MQASLYCEHRRMHTVIPGLKICCLLLGSEAHLALHSGYHSLLNALKIELEGDALVLIIHSEFHKTPFIAL